MRLREIYNRFIDIEIEELEIRRESREYLPKNTNNLQNKYIIVLRNEFRRNISKCFGVKIFEEENQKIENAFFKDDFLEYDESQLLNEGVNVVNKIKSKINLFIEMFESLFPEVDETTISIKLPEPKDLNDLSKTYGKLEVIFNQLITKKDFEDAKIEIKNFDHGSFWTDIALNSTSFAIAVGSLTWSAKFINNQIMKKKMEELEYKKLNLEKDHYEAIVTAQKKLIDTYIEGEAKAFQDEYYSEKNNEQLLRVKNSIKEFAKLIENGAEAHIALGAANEIKTEYPDFNKFLDLKPKRKAIEDKVEI